MIFEHDPPLLLRQTVTLKAGATWVLAAHPFGAAKDIGTGIGRSSQNPQDGSRRRRFKPHTRIRQGTGRKQEAMLLQMPRHLAASAQVQKAPEDQRDGLLDLQIGVFDDSAIIEADVAYRELDRELTALGLVLDA